LDPAVEAAPFVPVFPAAEPPPDEQATAPVTRAAATQPAPSALPDRIRLRICSSYLKNGS
jgi:hypothetical protein